jgi:tRNA pseudouridine55 synthase
MNSVEGLLLIDKPPGLTSYRVVDRVRRKLGIKRVGHAGTLDPMATGLLLILIGKATKTSQYLTGLNKGYCGSFKLGQTTDSHDADGKILETRPVPNLTQEQIKQYFDCFLGDQQQIPPMYSAKKVKGTRLYKIARQGKTIEREPHFIRIFEIKLTGVSPSRIDFSILCSKGTYVRTVIHDLGEKIGCGAHLTALRRTLIHKFRIEDAISLETFENMDLSQIQKQLLPVNQVIPSHIL